MISTDDSSSFRKDESHCTDKQEVSGDRLVLATNK